MGIEQLVQVKMCVSVYIPSKYVIKCSEDILNLNHNEVYAYVNPFYIWLHPVGRHVPIGSIFSRQDLKRFLAAWRYFSWMTTDGACYIGGFTGVSFDGDSPPNPGVANSGPWGDDEILFNTIAPYAKGNINVATVADTEYLPNPYKSYYFNYGPMTTVLESGLYKKNCLEKI